MSAAGNNPKTALRDRLIPWYFVMAFAVVFVVNGIFIYMAMQTHNGIVTENPYEKGLAYEQIVQEVKQQRASSARRDAPGN